MCNSRKFPNRMIISINCLWKPIYHELKTECLHTTVLSSSVHSVYGRDLKILFWIIELVALINIYQIQFGTYSIIMTSISQSSVILPHF